MNKILKKTLKHYIDLEHYANGVAYEIEEELNELYAKCNKAVTRYEYLKTKAEYTAIHTELEEYLEEFEEELEDNLEKEAETVKEKESNFLSKVYGAALAVGTIALSKLLFVPFDGRDTVKSFAERAVKNISRSYDNALRSGYMFGKKSSEVNEQTQQQLKQVTRGIKNGVITAIPSFAKTTDKIVFLKNDIEVVYVATLDGRTCINCASMSGLKFKNIALAPSVPQHALCRCILIPSSEVTGPVPEFEEFIESLSEEEQKEVLGANRFNLWKEYSIKLDKFLNDGRIIPLKDLDKDLLIKEAANNTAKKMFPNEKWEERYKNVFIAGNRNPMNKNQKSIFEKEFNTAKIASDNGHVIYMLPEKGEGKHPDTVMDNVLTDFKKVTGNIKTIGQRFVEGMEQGKNIYMQIESDYTFEQIRNKLKGEKMAHHYKNGKVFIYLKEKEFEINIKDL